VTEHNDEFKSKNILVTGAGRGIGKRLALGFARRGARIALVGRSKAELDLAQIEIEQNGGNALKLRADVTDEEQLRAAFERAKVTFGSAIDILICAAGVAGPLSPFIDASLAEWTNTISINLLGVVHSVRAALPAMIEKRSGKILAIACYTDSHPRLNFSAYETSKTATARFVESLSVELSDYNIQINCFDPGAAYTNFTDEIISAGQKLDPAVVADAMETRRTGGVAPELQLAHAAFLVSTRSNHLTGKVIHVQDDLKRLSNSALRPDSYTLKRVSK
jgi:3-oxoacyl-[acyl-carrier protein] reductase